jgi:hypothetical protein
MHNSTFKISPNWFIAYNFISFQIAWLMAINWKDQALLPLAAVILIHFAFSKHRKRDWLTFVLITLVGSFVDLTAAYANLFVFENGQLLPIWLILLWANFSLTFHYSMHWLMRLPTFLQSLVGGIFGTASYFAAFKFGAVHYPMPMSFTLFFLIVIWSVNLPVFVLITEGIQGKIDATKQHDNE